ncbi:MAG: ATP-binding protein [Gammaproteobacteria bacterium]|nr:ATP-binding protein [Gammaproteobacteria bacterium]
MGNIAQIQRVLENLISNAIRFTPESGKVTISVVQGIDSISVAVSDSGPGIPEDRLPRVFDRFYRASDDDEATSDSAGLGLAIAKQILELHDSRISVSSKVGAGSRFEFELPLINEAD